MDINVTDYTYADTRGIATRIDLEARFGQVWDTKELQTDFTVVGFAAPFVVVIRKSDGVKGSLEFTHSPRFYYAFTEAN